MDLQTILKFQDYTPNMDEDPRELLESYMSDIDYLTDEELQKVWKAYEFALDAHGNVRRLSGESYIVHPVHVLWYLLQIKPDCASMQTALLHDVIEDTDYTYDDIVREFGKEVGDLCEWLVKVAKVRFRWEKRQIETLKKTFLAMGKDLRVIFIKLADRVHNIQTLHYHPKPEKRNRIAEETLNIFVPIAKRLWLYVYQGLLENWSFRNLKPKEYKRIIAYVQKKYPHVDDQKHAWVDRLTYLCEQEWIACIEIKWRLKSPYRIRKKLVKYQTSDISKVIDILAFRIITWSVSDCYTLLGIIHKHYTPIFSKMKDYISLPKPNGYRSLHTTVLGMFSTATELQIRTKEMNAVAELWVAAHFAYSDDNDDDNITIEQSKWIQKLQDIVAKYKDEEQGSYDEAFKSELNVEILQKKNFVYTPKGDIFELPLWSTVLDFAFRIHSDVWLKYKGGFVNGTIVPIDYEIHTGDIVDISTYKKKYTANQWWLKYLKTPSARTKLQRYLKQMSHEETMSKMKDLINVKLQEVDKPLIGTKLDIVRNSYTLREREDAMRRIHDKQISVTKFLKQHYPEELLDPLLPKKKTQISSPRPIAKNMQKKVVVDYDNKMEVVFDPDCHATIDDKIIAKVDKKGIKIHTVWCPSLAHVSIDKLYEAHRYAAEANTYTLHLMITARNGSGVMIGILQVFSDFGYSVESIVSYHDDPVFARISFDVMKINPARISFLFKELDKKMTIIKIEKRFS